MHARALYIQIRVQWMMDIAGMSLLLDHKIVDLLQEELPQGEPMDREDMRSFR